MAVTNPYYEFTPEFIPGTKARSEEVNLQYQAIQNAFDFLPSDADAISTGTATFAPESGAGNAYVVTMPNTRTTEQDGDEVIFFATHTNTGAATLDVDGLGAKAIVRADGNAVTANDLQNGLLYVLRYDASNTRYQLVGPSTSYLTDAAASAAAAAASEAAAAISEALAAEWASNPIDDDVTGSGGQFSALHWASGAAEWATRARDSLIPVNFGGDGATDYSALHWSDGASEWAIRAEDSPIPATVGGDGATTYSAFHWAQKALGAAAGVIRIIGDIPTATPPTSEAVTAELEYYDADETDLLFSIGFPASNAVFLRNRMHGGAMYLQGEDGSGAATTLFFGDPDSSSKLYHGGIERLSTGSSGSLQVKGDFTSDFNARRIDFMYSDGTSRAYVGHSGDTEFRIRNQIHGAVVSLQGETGAGAVRTMLMATPGAAVDIYHDNTSVVQTLAAASGGLQVNNTLTGAGFERVLTTSDVTIPTYANTGFEIRSAGNTDGENRILEFTYANSTRRAFIGHDGGTTFTIQNEINSGIINIDGFSSTGVDRRMMFLNPNADVGIYHAGNVVAGTLTAANGGWQVNNTLTGVGFERVLTTSDIPSTVAFANTGFEIRSAGNTDPENRLIEFTHSNSTVRGLVGYETGSSQLKLVNDITSQGILLQGKNGTGTDYALYSASYLSTVLNTDALMYFRFSNVNRMEIISQGVFINNEGGFYIEEDTAAGTDIAGAGQLWVLQDAPNRLMFTDDTGQDHHVAMNGGFAGDNVNVNNSWNFNTAGNYSGNFISYHGDGGNDTITLGNSTGTGLTNFPIYDSITIIAPTSGNITITEGTGTTLFDETGTDTVGGVVLSGGAVTIFRASATSYIIFGNGYT